ncbi:MAG: RDD family protein [Candidatus Acidiferrales bacterium]
MTQLPSAQSVSACSQCGRTFAQSDLVQIAGSWVCGDCKTAFLSRVVAGGASANSQWHYGGFWIRFAGVFIDGILMQVVKVPMMLLILGAVVTPFGKFGPNQAAPLSRAVLTVTFVSVFIAFLYEVIMIRYYGATLGKMAVGVKVIRTDGSGVSWGTSIGRYFMKIVSAMILAIGYIMAGFDEEKRALHDRVCDTRVIYKRGVA